MLTPPGGSTGLIDTLDGAALPENEAEPEPEAACEAWEACEVIVTSLDVEVCCVGLVVVAAEDVSSSRFWVEFTLCVCQGGAQHEQEKPYSRREAGKHRQIPPRVTKNRGCKFPFCSGDGDADTQKWVRRGRRVE
jgi:hypothetical protein